MLKCLRTGITSPETRQQRIIIDLANSQGRKTLVDVFYREMLTRRQTNLWFKKEFPVVCIMIVVLLAVMVISLIFAGHCPSQTSPGVAVGQHLQKNTSKNLERNNSSEVKDEMWEAVQNPKILFTRVKRTRSQRSSRCIWH